MQPLSFKRNLASLIKRQQYQNANIITISTSALYQNLSYLSSTHPSTAIAPVIKSNAYGHGLIEIAKLLDDKNLPFFCVDSLYEAYELYKARIKTKILVMGYVNPENIKVKRLPFSYAVYDKSLLPILNRYQKGCGIHVKIDTGMHRLGVSMTELLSFLAQLKNYRHIQVEGLMSHLAAGDKPDESYTKQQIENFQTALALCHANGFEPAYQHLSASGGFLHLDRSQCNIARIGLALYGIHEAKQIPDLQPVLALKSHIAQIKSIEPGEIVGYDGTFIAKKSMTIAILPIGYNDGMDRRLSNHGVVLVHGMPCPIVGNVSMNMASVDVTDVSAAVHDEVIIFSSNATDANTIEHVAETCKTIAHDILIHLHPSTKRVITD